MTTDTAVNYIEKHFNFDGLTDSQKAISKVAFRKIRDAVEVIEILKGSMQMNEKDFNTLKEWMANDK